MVENPTKTILLHPQEDRATIAALSSEVRLRILELLSRGPHNVNAIALALGLPQSTVATNVATLEAVGLIHTESVKARKGSQKVCSRPYGEILIRFPVPSVLDEPGVEVSMPIGLYTGFEVTSPCGLCSENGVVGYLDVPDSFLLSERMNAGLLWFGQGWVEYKFPNNGRLRDRAVTKLELVAELSSETPGTNRDWPSDITLWINGVEVGFWTSPGDFGDIRGTFTPLWWKLGGSQYGLLKHWSVTREGSFVDGVRISDITLDDLGLVDHHSIQIRLGVKEGAGHRGGLNLFGRGFGHYGRDLLLRLQF